VEGRDSDAKTRFALLPGHDPELGMHHIKSIRDNPQAFDAALKRRGLTPMSASLLALYEGSIMAAAKVEKKAAAAKAATPSSATPPDPKPAK
jgi:hypothetical protein